MLKQLDGLTEETDGSFSYQRTDDWLTDSNAAYSGGTAMTTSVNNNEVSILFAGSGISLIHSLWDQGGNAQFRIDFGREPVAERERSESVPIHRKLDRNQ